MKFTTILADPPWTIPDSANRWAGAGGSRARATPFPYKVQTLDWIKRLPVGDLAEPAAHLYLWVPSKLNREGDGVAVVRAWGFDVVSEIVWSKPNFGLGKFPRPQHEILLVARRGKLPFQLNNVGSVQRWSQPTNRAAKIHSAKPEDCCDLIQRASPPRYVELFARRMRIGWDCWGDEVLSTIQFGPIQSAGPR